MSNIRKELVHVALNRARAITNHDGGVVNSYKSQKQTILDDESLTKDEKLYAINNILDIIFDYAKVSTNQGTKRICEYCQKECLATLYCEYCIRNYITAKFSSWTSENVDIDNLIQNCQMETYSPDNIGEWIPYNKLQNVKYLTEGGCSKIYTADWTDGPYDKWNNKERQLIRYGTYKVALKKLEYIENTNRNWFDECKYHLIINNKWGNLTKCYGLTKDPSDGSYMLVMMKMDNSLREYLQNHCTLTWKERLKIINSTIDIAMLMWEISSGQPPFINFEHDYDLALKIINGMRPKVMPGTPLRYKKLMEQCWDANPEERPDIWYLRYEILEMLKLYYQNESNEQQSNDLRMTNDYIDSSSVNSLVRKFSKVYVFENFPEPRNATKEEQKVYHSVQQNLSIPNKIEDIISRQTKHQIGLNDSSVINNEAKSKSKRIYFDDDDNEEVNKNVKSKKIKLSNNKEFQYIQKSYTTNDVSGFHMEDDEITNNPNLHSEDQESLEIPEEGF
ncbi:kinase-like domain-containing protein [Rhizophagus clarus]|uniref:Kinase-like domain-containing protein n=1 Tax=Rhizophagus clarus TaxID=94130 RepID=A0A8H3QVC6_9GLOM|nr:kinase-like domain-containing protein [Rhizophagus clarus]